MFVEKYLTVAFLTFFSLYSFASESLEHYPLKSIVGIQDMPDGLIQITAEAEYPSGCYKPDSLFAEVDTSTSTIYLSHIVLKQNSFCIQKIVDNFSTVLINKMRNGVYEIVDKSNFRLIGEVEINGP
jgi:hypothetical protein